MASRCVYHLISSANLCGSAIVKPTAYSIREMVQWVVSKVGVPYVQTRSVHDYQVEFSVTGQVQSPITKRQSGTSNVTVTDGEGNSATISVANIVGDHVETGGTPPDLTMTQYGISEGGASIDFITVA